MTDSQQNQNAAEPSSSLSSSSSTTPPQQAQQQQICANCSKPEASEDEAAILKPCTSCKTTLYCSRDCKKADLKKHKKVCASLAQEWFDKHGDEVKMASGGGGGSKKEGYQKGLRKWQFDT